MDSGILRDGALSGQGNREPAVEVHLTNGRLREGDAKCPLALWWRCKGLRNRRGSPCKDESIDEGVSGAAVGRGVQQPPDSP